MPSPSTYQATSAFAFNSKHVLPQKVSSIGQRWRFASPSRRYFTSSDPAILIKPGQSSSGHSQSHIATRHLHTSTRKLALKTAPTQREHSGRGQSRESYSFMDDILSDIPGEEPFDRPSSGPSCRPRFDSSDHASSSRSAPTPSPSRGSLSSLLRSQMTIPDSIAPIHKPKKGVHIRRDRSQGQTPEEAKIFNNVLAGLFEGLARSDGPLRPGSNPITDPFGGQIPGPGGVGVGAPAFGRGRGILRQPGRLSEAEEAEVRAEVDELKEELSSISTESELVAWAERRVFATRKYPDSKEPRYSRAYPHILAHLIQSTRQSFQNPNLALAFFQHAQTLSLESYICGCLTPAYNELLQTRWEVYHDLEGINQGVKEMEVNGVTWDRQTRKLVGGICEELSASSFLSKGNQEESFWRDHVAARWRQLEDRVQYDVEMEEGVYERLQEAKRMQHWGQREWGMSQPSSFARSRHRHREEFEDETLERGGFGGMSRDEELLEDVDEWDMVEEPKRAFG